MSSMIKKLNHTGDTIVEVLICLAIIGSALTISYGVSRRSLNQIQDAHERGEMLNIGRSQIERIKQYSKDHPEVFTPGPSSSSIVQADGSGKIFCIDETFNLRVETTPTPRNTACATKSNGEFISMLDPNYAKTDNPSADIVDATYPYRSAVVYHPRDLVDPIDHDNPEVSEFYVLTGRYGAGGFGNGIGNSLGYSIVPLMYRQYP